MRTLNIAIVAIVCCVIGAGLHSLLSRSRGETDVRTAVIVDTVRYVDTIVYVQPLATKEKQRTVGHKKMTVAKHIVNTHDSMLPKIRDETDSTIISEADSMTVDMPIEQKVYEAANYRAYVSGIEANLDSIQVYTETRTTMIRESPKRWHIGLMAGYGVTAKGMQPYVGVGITYSIFSF